MRFNTVFEIFPFHQVVRAFECGWRGKVCTRLKRKRLSVVGLKFVLWSLLSCSWLSILLMLAYMGTVIVILLNILIAQMSTTYTQAKRVARLEYDVDRISLLTRMERFPLLVSKCHGMDHVKRVCARAIFASCMYCVLLRCSCEPVRVHVTSEYGEV